MDDLSVKVFIADEVRIGTTYDHEMWIKSFAILEEPLYIKEGGDYYVVKFEDRPDEIPFCYVGDFLRLKGINWGSGVEIYNMYFKVTSIWMKDEKPYKYTLSWVAGDNLTVDVDPGNVFVVLGESPEIS
jgi:hypothetical protein